MARTLYQPMLLSTPTALPEGEDWVFEPKLDGWRLIAETAPDQTVLRTRQGRNCTSEFPLIADQLQTAVNGLSAVVDGEIIGLDPQGHHNVRTVRNRTSKIVYYLFDLLELEGEPLINQPWHERRRLLEETMRNQGDIALCAYFNDFEATVRAAHSLALEGVVAKKVSSTYQPGKRSRDWQKFKFNPHARGWRR